MKSANHTPLADPAATEEAAPTRGRRRGAVRALWLNLLLLTALVAVLIAWVDLGSVWSLLAGLSPLVIGLALLIASLDRVLMGLKWRHLIVAAGSPLRVRDAVSAYYQSGFASRVVPLGVAQDVLRGYLVGRRGVPSGLVLGSITAEKLMALLANLLLAACGALYLFSALDAATRTNLALALVAGFGLAGLAAALAFSASLHGAATERLIHRLPERIQRVARRWSESLLLYRNRPAVLGGNFLLALVEQSAQFAKFFVLGRALGVDLGFVAFLATIAVVFFARRVTGYFEGWGLGEAAAVLTFTLLGLTSEAAVALAASNYAITTLATLPGAYLLYRAKLGLGGRSLSTVSARVR